MVKLAECPTCGDTLETAQGMRAHHKLVHDESIRETVECEYCGSEYVPHGNNRGRFCSQACVGRWNSENKTGEDAYHWEGGTVDVTCSYCGDVFEVPPYREDAAQYCSAECGHEGRAVRPKDERTPYYGRNWSRMRDRVRKRDGACRTCGESDGLLDVHHIVPLRTFDEPEDANTMDNLVLLCRACHKAAEVGNVRKLAERGKCNTAMAPTS